MMNRKNLAIGFVAAVLALAVFLPSGCYYDNEVEQYGVATCDTTAISYSQDILPIINNNCVRCHTPGGEQEGSPFTSYEQIKDYSGPILERVNGIGSIMPPDGAIPACDKLKIEAWVNAGTPNN